MTGQRTLPNLGLVNRWTPGTSGWGGDLDGDLATLDALLFLQVKSTTATAPIGTPAEGDRYVIPTGGTGPWAGVVAGSVGIYRDAAWALYAPRAGWEAQDAATGFRYAFNGTTWTKREQPYDIMAYFPVVGAAAAGPLLSLLIRRATRFPVGLAGSKVDAKTAATALTQLPITRNGTAVGSLNFAAGATAGTLTFAAEVMFALDDVLEVMPPTAADTTLAKVRLALVGFR